MTAALDHRRAEPLHVDDLLGRLESVRRLGEGRWSARCPAHGDKSPSLSVRLGDDGRILLHCFSNCSFEAVVAALGVEAAQLFPPSNEPWRPSRPRHDPQREARALLHRLERIHRVVPAPQLRAELLAVGALALGGTRRFPATPPTCWCWPLRLAVEGMESLRNEGTPRRWFSRLAVAREIDRVARSVAGADGYATAAGVLGFLRMATCMARKAGRG